MRNEVKTAMTVLQQRLRSTFAGRRAGVRMIAVAGVAIVYGMMFYLAAQAPERPPSDGVMDTVSVDLFHGDAVVRAANPKAETVAEATPSKPAPAPVEALTPPQTPPAETDAASDQDKVLQQVLAAVGNEPSFDKPAEPTPLTEAPPASAAYQQASRGGTACEITARVQDRLQATPEVHQALALIPRSSRSVANAVMIWNGAWIDPMTLGGEGAIMPLQTVIMDEVKLASEKCRREEVRGPRFLTLMDENGTAIVVIGNGVWRWADVAPRAEKSWFPWLRFGKTL